MGGCEGVLVDRLPDQCYLVTEKAQVVDGGEAQSEDFGRAEQVMEIGSTELSTGVAVTFLIERCMEISEPALLNVDASSRREQCPVTS